MRSSSTKIHIITDTHFGHTRLIDYGRPEGFETQIALGIQKKVNAGDILLHLGDFCIGNDERWAQLYKNATPGVLRYLIVGNHDNKSNHWYLEHGFHLVARSLELKHLGKKILFSHKPRLRQEGIDYNLHGHFHGDGHRLDEETRQWYDPAYHIAHDIEGRFSPVSLEHLLNEGVRQAPDKYLKMVEHAAARV